MAKHLISSFTPQAPLQIPLQNFELEVQSILEMVRHYLPEFNDKKFIEAFSFAAEAHRGQVRQENNKPYIIHPLETVKILVSLQADEDTLIAALLHDVPEDTSRTLAEIEERFGRAISFLVNGVTKLSKVHFRENMNQLHVESLKKLFIASAEDPRVLLIKLADRLHNMRTLQFIGHEQKRLRIAKETQEIFVPVAQLLGIGELATEMENLCLHFLLPEQHKLLKDTLELFEMTHKEGIGMTTQMVQKECDQQQLPITIFYISKNLARLHRKIINKGYNIDNYPFTLNFGIIVNSVEECYRFLGILHHLFKPKPGSFKDFIAVPKINGYQALHTLIFGPEGIMHEFRIFTQNMYLIAQHGIAARIPIEGTGNERLLHNSPTRHWIENIYGLHEFQNGSGDFFLESLKKDLLQERIFVFTPKGEPIDLPKDASAIDFAYSIHTLVGHKAICAQVNGDFVPLSTVLHTDDTVKIITHDDQNIDREIIKGFIQNGPDLAWLHYAKTSVAQNKIQEFFRKESRLEKIKAGKDLLQKDFLRFGLGFVDEVPKKRYLKFLRNHSKYRIREDIFAAIGEGSITSLELIHSLFPAQKGLGKVIQKATKYLPLPFPQKQFIALKIYSKIAEGQLEKLLKVFDRLGIPLLHTSAYVSPVKRVFVARFSAEARSFEQLQALFEQLEMVENVFLVKRVFWRRKVFLILTGVSTFILWALHPYILFTVFRLFPGSRQASPFSMIFLYLGLVMLFLLVSILKRTVKKNFPELYESSTLWTATVLLNGFAFFTIFAEIYFFRIPINWELILGFAVFVSLILYSLRDGFRVMLGKASK